MLNATADIPAPPLKWQRPALAILAGAGLLDTGYLLLAHMAGQSVACPGTGLFQCDAVVNSVYSKVLGLPLAAWGFGAYLTVLLLAALPLLVRAAAVAGPVADAPTADRSLFGLRLLTTAMALMSGVLLFLMLGVLHTLCLYCVFSVILSVSLFAVANAQPGWRFFHPKPQMAGVGLAALMIGAIAVSQPVPATTTNADGPQVVGLDFGDFRITTTSGASELALAQHLAQRGARMYGGFQCPHCIRQKQLFGTEAIHLIAYVECDPRSPAARRDMCEAGMVKQYPTWIVGDLRIEGEQDLAKLADLTGYVGPRNFLRRIQRD